MPKQQLRLHLASSPLLSRLQTNREAIHGLLRMSG